MRNTAVSRHQRRARWQVLALAVAALCVGAMALPGDASAARVSCAGKTIPNKDVPGYDGFAYDYSFFCNEDVYAFSVISNRQIEYFSPSAEGRQGGSPTAESFECEGLFPGEGVGCHGLASPPSRIVGQIGLDRNPCAKRKAGQDRWRVWVTVTVQEAKPTAPDKPYYTQSEPVALGGPCKARHKRNVHRHRA
ncbi:MAG: hypothetical protein U0R52_07785 [Solirubrobacterales bacterium]